MANFDTVEDTLFVPMLGRIYASEKFPNILCDKKALELKSKLPADIKGKDTQTQYTLMASAVRSTNMDRYIKDFISKNPKGVIAMLGAGLETTFYRNDNGKTVWYEIDLPDVIEYRNNVLGENERDIALPMDAFSKEWIQTIRNTYKDEPILVTASGLFYYFSYEKVVNLLKMLKEFGNIEVVFDTVNKTGMKQMSKYMKQVGHEDAQMFFYVDKGEVLASEVGGKVVNEEAYYKYTDKKGLDFVTSVSMKVSDKFKMVKMEHIKLN